MCALPLSTRDMDGLRVERESVPKRVFLRQVQGQIASPGGMAQPITVEARTPVRLHAHDPCVKRERSFQLKKHTKTKYFPASKSGGRLRKYTADKMFRRGEFGHRPRNEPEALEI